MTVGGAHSIADPGVRVVPADDPSGAASTHPIAGPYLLVVNIPFASAERGVAVDPLWAKDLAEHGRYIDRLLLAAPAGESPAAGDVTLPIGGRDQVAEVVRLPNPRSTFAAVIALPQTVLALWRAVGRSRIVHCGTAGWPFPLGWLAAPIAALRGRFLIVLVESAPWRAAPGERRSLKQRLHSWVYETMAGWCLRRADLALVTQAEYARSLAPGRTKPTHVLHASWIDEQNVLSDAAAVAAWAEKSGPGPLRIAYAGRLERAKGVEVLLAAAGELAPSGVPVELDIYGEGDLMPLCRAAAAEIKGSVAVRVRGVLAYGEAFFAALRAAHLVVVPSISDEQPRIVFDVFSQAVPVLASDTAGLRDCVAGGSEGEFVPPGDAGALARAIRDLGADRGRLRAMGLAGLRRARSLTHREMHRKRCEYILDALNGGAGSR